MLEKIVRERFRNKELYIIDLDDEEVQKLRKAVAYSNLSEIRKEIMKSLDFVSMKLERLDERYRTVLSEIKDYATAVVYGRNSSIKHQTILTYLSRCRRDTENYYESLLISALYSLIRGLYSEQAYMDAVLLEFSSAFASQPTEKELEKNYSRIERAILLQIDELTASLSENRKMIHNEPNTEFIRMYARENSSRREKKESRPDREEEGKEKFYIEKSRELNLDRCKRVHVHRIREHVAALYNEISNLNEDGIRRYSMDLFKEVKGELLSKDPLYEKLFEKIKADYERVCTSSLSKRKFKMSVAPLLSYSARRGRLDLKLAKLVHPLLLSSLEGTVSIDMVKLLFDFALEDGTKADEILTREKDRIGLSVG